MCLAWGRAPRREESPGREAVQVQQGSAEPPQCPERRGVGPRQHPVGGLEVCGCCCACGHPRLRGRSAPRCPPHQLQGAPSWPPALPRGARTPRCLASRTPRPAAAAGLLCPLPPYTIQGAAPSPPGRRPSAWPGPCKGSHHPPEASQAWRRCNAAGCLPGPRRETSPPLPDDPPPQGGK